jgi:hypothetical protein
VIAESRLTAYDLTGLRGSLDNEKYLEDARQALAADG